MDNLSQAEFMVLDEAFRELGPLSWEAILERVRRGQIQPTSWVWNSRDERWRLAAELPELCTLMPPSPVLKGQAEGNYAQPIFGPPQPETARVHWQAGPTSLLAIGAFLCGLAGLWLGPLGIAAIGLGHLAEWRFHRQPPVMGGFALALYGLWLGYLALAMLLYHVIRHDIHIL